VIGTVTTIESRADDDAFAAVVGVKQFSAARPAFVDFVKLGITSSRQLLGLAEAYPRHYRTPGWAR
jgi:glutamate racemase